MKFCPQCGSSLQNAVKFCMQCGTEIPVIGTKTSTVKEPRKRIAWDKSLSDPELIESKPRPPNLSQSRSRAQTLEDVRINYHRGDKNGWLSKQSGILARWKLRWCVLDKETLYIYKKKEDGFPKSSMKIRGSTVDEAPYLSRVFAFHIFSGDTHEYLAGESESEMTQWINALLSYGAEKKAIQWSGKNLIPKTSTKALLEQPKQSKQSEVKPFAPTTKKGKEFSKPSESTATTSRQYSTVKIRSKPSFEDESGENVEISAPILVTKPNPIVAKRNYKLDSLDVFTPRMQFNQTAKR